MMADQLSTMFCRVRTILLDSQVGKQFGGTGAAIPWSDTVDVTFALPLILAGGLNKDNVREAISTVRPNGVDVAGGVENFPGKKDPELMNQFVAEAKSAMAETTPKNRSLG